MTIDLVIKSPDMNTIGKQRLSALASGNGGVSTTEGINMFGVPRLDAVEVSNIAFGQKVPTTGLVTNNKNIFSQIGRPYLSGGIDLSRNITPLDLPREELGGASVREAIYDGKIKMAGESLSENIDLILDTFRLELTIRKIGRATVRELVYNVIDNPNADQIQKLSELYPYAVEFKRNTGTGQGVEMGEARLGEYDTVEHFIYAAGFFWDLMRVLFDRTQDITKLLDAVALAESGLKDDLCFGPIFAYSYSGTQQTAASTVGTTREDKVYNTVQDAVDDIEARVDPLTGDYIQVMDAVIVASVNDAKHIRQVISGFTGVEQNFAKRPAIEGISRVIGYRGEKIVFDHKTVQYDNPPAGKAYLIVPNRRMLVSQKRGLQYNFDANPSVLTLAQEQHCWWYCEGIYDNGIAYFVQEITLPIW